uniref:Glypican 2 n=1 Tax=Chrysemys picta bellii TaxID=8478 RepID=A0A8C3H6G5_CHRPI
MGRDPALVSPTFPSHHPAACPGSSPGPGQEMVCVYCPSPLLCGWGELRAPHGQALTGGGFLCPPPSGEHLRICPQDYTCCFSEMEEQLSLQSDRDFRALVEDGASFLSSTLAWRHRRFEEFFRELLAAAERGLQAMFTQTYGRLYAQNARLFQGLFAELRRHQQGARLSLDEALGEFWARLLERMLPLLNPQYQFPAEYLECVARQGEALRPFGDVPRKLRLQVTRAFVAARAFVQGLATGRDVVAKASKVSVGRCVCVGGGACRGRRGAIGCGGRWGPEEAWGGRGALVGEMAGAEGLLGRDAGGTLGGAGGCGVGGGRGVGTLGEVSLCPFGCPLESTQSLGTH